MNPEIFLDQKDIPPLIQVLSHVFTSINVASDRHAILEIAGIYSSFIGNLNLDAQPNMFALELVAAFRSYSISRERLYYHPMIKLLEYLRDFAATYNLTDQDFDLFTRLIQRGKNNLQALIARSAVGRIESPQENGIGTGVLVGENLLLTCNHIFSKARVQQAWVRFNYQTGKFPLDIDLFELDLNFIKHSPHQDFALVKIPDKPKQNDDGLYLGKLGVPEVRREDCRPLEGYSYMLFLLEKRTTQDWESLTSIKELVYKAQDASSEGKYEEVKHTLIPAIRTAIYRSADVAKADRRPMVLKIEESLREFGLQAAKVPARSLYAIMQRPLPSIDQETEKELSTLERLFN